MTVFASDVRPDGRHTHEHIRIQRIARRRLGELSLIERGLLPASRVKRLLGLPPSVWHAAEADGLKPIIIKSSEDGKRGCYNTKSCYRIKNVASAVPLPGSVQELKKSELNAIASFARRAASGIEPAGKRSSVESMLASSAILCARSTMPGKRKEFIFEVLPPLVESLRSAFPSVFPAALFVIGALKRPESEGIDAAIPVPRSQSWKKILCEAREACSSLVDIQKIDLSFILNSIYYYRIEFEEGMRLGVSPYLLAKQLHKDYPLRGGGSITVTVSANLPFSISYRMKAGGMGQLEEASSLHLPRWAKAEIKRVEAFAKGMAPSIYEFAVAMDYRLSGEHVASPKMLEKIARVLPPPGSGAHRLFVRHVLSHTYASPSKLA